MTRTPETCPPRFATPRNLSRETLGPKVAQYAQRELGLTLMPWQRLVLDVALELDQQNNFPHREVDVTVGRQNGKTTLILPWVAWRMHRFGGRQRAIYTAQDGVSAREKFVTDFVELVAASPLAAHVDVRLANGSESMTWRRTRSMWGIKAPTRKAGHGSTLDMAVGDEIFAHEDDRLEQSLRPTMRTRRSPQFLFTSTAGDDRSRYLWTKVKAGRLQVQTGTTGPVAYFEWSAPSPAELGIEDWGDVLAYVGNPDTWAQANPALGHTITLATLRDEWAVARRTQEGVEQFCRTVCNMWVRQPADTEGAGWQIISKDDWVACAVPTLPRPTALSVGLCIVERNWSLTARQDHDGGPVLDHVATGVGLDKAVAEITRVADRGVAVTVAIDPSTTAGTVLQDLLDLEAKRDDVVVHRLGRRESMQACMRLAALVKDRRVGVLDSDLLTAAAAAAVREGAMGELWEFGRSPVSAPIVAAALAAAVPRPDAPDPNERFVH